MKLYSDLNTNLKEPHLYEFIANLGFSRISSNKKKIHSSIDIVSHLNLCPKDPKELLFQLKKKRLRYEIISVTCYNKSVARQSGKDKRVDLIKFPLNSSITFNYNQSKLMKKSGSALQIEIIGLLEQDRNKLSKNIQRLKKQVQIAEKNNIPIVLCSGANDKFQLRTPRGIIALATMLEIDEKIAQDMITKIPNRIVNRNRERLSDKFIMPGVWLF